jgi:hypothetical protein
MQMGKPNFQYFQSNKQSLPLTFALGASSFPSTNNVKASPPGQDTRPTADSPTTDLSGFAQSAPLTHFGREFFA